MNNSLIWYVAVLMLPMFVCFWKTHMLFIQLLIMFVYFIVFRSESDAAVPTTLESGQIPVPIVPRDKIRRKGKPLTLTHLRSFPRAQLALVSNF